MKNSVCATVLAVSVVAVALLGASPAYATTAKDRIAIINADGTKESGQSVSSLRIGTGTYEVLFNRDITKCTATITVGSPTSTGAANAYATAVQRLGSGGTGYFIVIRTDAGVLINAEFMLLVSCRTAS